MRLEVFEVEEAVDHIESVESIDVMLSVSENGEAIAGSELIATVEDSQYDFGLTAVTECNIRAFELGDTYSETKLCGCDLLLFSFVSI